MADCSDADIFLPAGAVNIYAPLNRSRREIRLVHIIPDDGRHVRIELQVVSLDDFPVYEALSYCWGDPNITAPIEVNGKIKEVTVSLEAAVREFRQQANGHTVILWVDAICINQADLGERSQQVTIMPDIYRSAQRVRAWLGHLPKGTADAFQRVVAKSMERPMIKRIKLGLRDLSEDDTHHILGEVKGILRPGESLSEFAACLSELEMASYWTRTWIIQEAALAQQFRLYFGNVWVDLSDDQPRYRWYKPSAFLAEISHALFYCTDQTFVELASSLSSSRYDTYVIFRELNRKMSNIVLAWTKSFPASGEQYSRGSSALDLNFIVDSREARCSESRDCIFAIQGLVSGSTVTPDYTASVDDIFTRFTIQAIETQGSLQMLDFACSDKDTLPSWVPDYTSKAVYRCPSDANASIISSTSVPFSHTKPGQLCVPALVVADIAAAPATPHKGSDSLVEYALRVYNCWNDTYHDVVRALAAKKGIQPSTKDLADLDVFWDALDAGHGMMPQLEGDFSSLRHGLESLHSGADEQHVGRETIVELINAFTDTFYLFFTSAAQPGAVRKLDKTHVAPGDLVMIIATAKMPFCGRGVQVEDQEAFQLLNTCYMSGTQTTS